MHCFPANWPTAGLLTVHPTPHEATHTCLSTLTTWPTARSPSSGYPAGAEMNSGPRVFEVRVWLWPSGLLSDLWGLEHDPRISARTTIYAASVRGEQKIGCGQESGRDERSLSDRPHYPWPPSHTACFSASVPGPQAGYPETWSSMIVHDRS